MNITQLLNRNCFPGANNPRFIVLHGTAGGTSAQEIGAYFQGTATSDNPVSATYVIGQDGTIVQCNNESDGAWGNGVITGTPTPNLPFRTVGDGIHRDDWWNENTNPNNISISIEHCKPDDQNATALTPAQQAASFWLVKDICTRHNIPMRFADSSGGITGHFSIDVADRSLCPNTYPWSDLWTYLNGETTMAIDLSTPGVSNYFEGSTDIWQCKQTGFAIGHGILGFYQKFGGDALCGITYLGLPTGPETGTGTAGTVYQRFERGVLAYDPQHTIDSPPQAKDVYCMHIDKGLGQDPRIAQLESQITALKTLPGAANLATINSLVAQASTAIAQAGTAIAKIGPLSQVQ